MSTLQGNPRAAPFLTRHRPRFMRAWLLHTWLILSMLLLPAARLARADGEGGFTLTGTESSVAVNVWAPEGTSGMQQGDTRQEATARLPVADAFFNGDAAHPHVAEGADVKTGRLDVVERKIGEGVAGEMRVARFQEKDLPVGEQCPERPVGLHLQSDDP